MADDRNKINQNAEKLVRQGKIDQAISLYEQLLGDTPRDMNLKNKIGDLYVRAGDVPGAVKVFSEIADFYSEEGFYLKAIAVCKKINRQDPSNVGCYYRLADLYAKQGLNNDAKSQYQQLSELFLKEGNSAKAADAIDKLLKIDPDNLMARYKLIELLTSAGQGAKAIGEYRAIGEQLARGGRHEEAVKVYEKGLSLDASSSDLVAGMCVSLLELGRNDELIDRAKGAYAKNRENVPMLGALAEAYLRTGQTDLGRQVLEKLTGIEPDNERWKERLASAGEARPHPVGAASAGPGPARRAAVATAAAPAAGHAGASPGAAIPDFSEMTGDYSMEELGEVSGEWGAADLAPEAPAEEASGAPEARTGTEASRDEFILEHMTEAEVFIKYGLVEKAIDNLEAIVNHYPDEVESLRRLKDLYLETGNKKKAAERCVDLAKLARSRGEMQRALDLLAEARVHDPQVRLERPAPAAVVEEPAPSSSDVYSFGGPEESSGPVELDTAPASSHGGRAAADEAPAGSVTYDFGGDTAKGDDNVEFTLDETEGGGEEPIEIELENEEGQAGAEPEEGELAEADFYADGGFTDEARTRFESLRKKYPASRKVRERLERLGSRAPAAAAAGGEEGIEFFEEAIRAPRRDAAAGEAPAPVAAEDADDSLFEQENAFLGEAGESPAAGAAAIGGGAGVGDDSLEEIFREFKKGVEATIETEDYETHYNLGIAYREMELNDEAIAEFQLASKDPNRFVECCSHLGACFRVKGMPKLAIKWYTKALETVEMGSPQSIAILYDLGEAYEESGDKEKALETFTDVYGLDSTYREIAEKLSNLEG